MNPCDSLQAELAIYEAQKNQLLAEGGTGKFALIGDDVVGVFDTYEDALQVGYQTFGVSRRFLVKRIDDMEGVLYFTRDISTCQA